MATSDTEILTIKEAASYLRVHIQTLRRLLREGQVRGVKVGRLWRIHRAALEAFVLAAAEPASGALPTGLGEANRELARPAPYTLR